jgi:hypothetical protein
MLLYYIRPMKRILLNLDLKERLIEDYILYMI